MAMPAERNILPNVGGWKVFFRIDDGSRENGIRKWIGEIHFLLMCFLSEGLNFFVRLCSTQPLFIKNKNTISN